MERGIRSRRELAIRHGVTMQVVTLDLKAYWKEVKEEYRKEAVENAMVMERVLYYVYQQAIDSWERSKKNAEEITTSYDRVKCKLCDGTGFKPGTTVWCDECEGEGISIIERVTRREKGQAGDPAILRVALDSMKEIGKIQGIKIPDQSGVIPNVNQFFGNNLIDLSGLSDDDLLDAVEGIRVAQGIIRPKMLEAEFVDPDG